MEENPVQENKSSQQIISIEKTDCRNEDKQEETSKKPKQGSKQSLKAATKPTIPQPFNLSTEKRMSRERRGSVDFSADISKKRKPRERHGSMDFSISYSQPRLSQSASLSNKPQVKAAEHVESKIGSAQKMKNRTPLNGAESKQLKGNDKKERVVGMESSNLQKSTTTFKALPLPKFYQKKDSPPKSETETKKMPETNSKSPTLRSIKKPEITKVEDKGKVPSKTVTNGAKETISKLLRSTRKVLNTSKVTTKGIVSTA